MLTMRNLNLIIVQSWTYLLKVAMFLRKDFDRSTEELANGKEFTVHQFFIHTHLSTQSAHQMFSSKYTNSVGVLRSFDNVF